MCNPCSFHRGYICANVDESRVVTTRLPHVTAVQCRDGPSSPGAPTGEGWAMPPELQHSHNPTTGKLPSIMPTATTQLPRGPDSAALQPWARLQQITMDLVDWENWKGCNFQKLAEHLDLFHSFPSELLLRPTLQASSVHLGFSCPSTSHPGGSVVHSEGAVKSPCSLLVPSAAAVEAQKPESR